MALPETVVWIFIAYMIIPLVVLLAFWVIGLVRDARKKAKKAKQAEAADAERSTNAD
jgi:preprotein translocase subunit YajC